VLKSSLIYSYCAEHTPLNLNNFSQKGKRGFVRKRHRAEAQRKKREIGIRGEKSET
jgi:hypothetical protein